MRASIRRVMLVALVGAGAACKPDLGAPISLVDGPRILAVRGTPPEAKEGASVTYDLLAVDTTGTVVAPPARWAVCTKPRPPSEGSAVSSACLSIADAAGPAPTFQAPITVADPNDSKSTGACSIFGPLRPPLDPTARPRDPDVTGGFFEPVRATLDGPGGGEPLLAFDLERIQCRLASAPIEIANQFNNPYDPSTNPSGYVPNQNPLLAQLTLAIEGGAPAVLPPSADGVPDSSTPALAPGQRVVLEASWNPEAVESFPVYDIRAVALTTQREALRVSWFATGGVFDHDVTGRAADDPALSTDNGWLAPLATGVVHLWLVLRDSRGGVDFAEFALTVTP